MLRTALHRVATAGPLGAALTPFVERFVGGASIDEAVDIARDLAARGFRISVERATGMQGAVVGEVVPESLEMLHALNNAGLAPRAELAIFLHSLNRSMDQLTELCTAAQHSGVSLMVGMGAPETVDDTLDAVRGLRTAGFPVGVTLQAALRRTQRDCADFADGRIRLVKGGYHVRGGSVFTSPIEVDKSYVRCARVLLQEAQQPSFATHDPRLLEIVDSLITRYDRPLPDVEFAFYLARNGTEQRRMQEAGHPVRIYIPYGPQWFERLVDGFAEQPGGLVSALQSIIRP
jgi:proline dehydrogenase